MRPSRQLAKNEIDFKNLCRFSSNCLWACETPQELTLRTSTVSTKMVRRYLSIFFAAVEDTLVGIRLHKIFEIVENFRFEQNYEKIITHLVNPEP